VDAAIALFSGEKTGEQAREIWLVDKAPVVIQKLDAAVHPLDDFMQSPRACPARPKPCPSSRATSPRRLHQGFKEVQRLKTQLDQYTDLTETTPPPSSRSCPRKTCRASAAQYLETAQRLKAQQGKGGEAKTADAPREVDQLDFEFVLFASAVIDYDYIMGLIARFSQQGPGKQKMSREQLIGLISADAKFMNERDDIAAYINTLKAGEGLSEAAIREGYTRFKKEKTAPS
jgi:type I restriction enzyme R subunit